MRTHRIFLLLILSLSLARLAAQVPELAKIGQTPGGAGFHVNYDSTSQRLFVGCGTSIWVYDVADTNNIQLIAKRPLLGLVNETALYGDTLFVAATHDGLWALDITTDTLRPIAHYETKGDSAAYDIELSNDSIFLANGKKIQLLKFSASTGFVKIKEFGTLNAMGICRKKNLIAVCSRFLLNGIISVYNINNLSSPVATWTNNTIYLVYDVQFADLRDDIIYVCGGSNDVGSTGQFYALQLTGNALTQVGHYTINGVYGLAMAVVVNMDSRNDTLYLATTAGLNGVVTDVPVLDASGLPNDSLKVIAHIRPGQWHFDVSLIRGTPYLAISSEWLGVLISNISQLAPEDTLCFLPTGGWGHGVYLFGDTLWVCNEGYGLVAYKINDLYYSAGFIQYPAIFHIFTQFVSDFTFVDDTLIVLSTTEIYNIKPWFSGGQPALVADISNDGWLGVKKINTNTGVRIIAGDYVALSLKIYNPYDIQNNYPLLGSLSTQNNAKGFAVRNDTLWCGVKSGNTFSLAVYKVENDAFQFITSLPAPGEIINVAVYNDLVAVACSNAGFAWYRTTSDSLQELGRLTGWANDCSGIFLKNNYMYVANKLKGLQVYDITNPNTATLVATSKGSGGWEGRYGSTGVKVADNGTIFLVDYHGSAFIIEAFDTTSSSVNNITANSVDFSVYPNPCNDLINISNNAHTPLTGFTFILTNNLGQILTTSLGTSHNVLTLNLKGQPAGIYFIIISYANEYRQLLKFIKS